jgi:hypothetical protein
MKIIQHTPNPITGLTPLQQREKTLREKIDPITGLTALQLRTKKTMETVAKIDPITGLSIVGKNQKKMLEDIDPITGLNKKQRAALKAIEKMKNTIDPETGLSVFTLRNKKARESYSKRSDTAKKETILKTHKTITEVDPVTGLSINQKRGLKTSQHRKLIDPVTGLTNAQLIAKKNMESQQWLTNSTKGKASKESLRLFDPLSEKLQELGLTCYYGHSTGKEWWLKTQDGKVKFYDFTVPELKLIIEYQGERYHPNPETLSEAECSNWKTPYTNATANDVYANDQEKLKLANSNRFDVIYVWSSDDINKSLETILQIVNNLLR